MEYAYSEQVKVVECDDALVFGDLGEFFQLSRHRREINDTGTEELQRPIRDTPVSGTEDLTIRTLTQRWLVDHVVSDLDGIFFGHGERD